MIDRLTAASPPPPAERRYGTYPPEKGVNHKPDMHYPCQILLTKPLEPALLEKTLVKLCGEDGIEEETINVEVVDGEPADWPVGDEGQWRWHAATPSERRNT